MNLFVTLDLSVSKYLFKKEIYRVFCNKINIFKLPIFDLSFVLVN